MQQDQSDRGLSHALMAATVYLIIFVIFLVGFRYG
jgi:hypothetical protein